MNTMVKKIKHDEIINRIEAQMQPPEPTERISEAARKVLQGEFVRILKHEQGARTGEDIEDVHQMRVAIRQTRSLFHLLDGCYKPKVVRPLDSDLKKVMRVLAAVRDLDVMIADLKAADLALDAAQQASMDAVIDALDQRRVVARQELESVLSSKAYRRFVRHYEEFLLTPNAGVKKSNGAGIQPVELRHVLPPMIYEYLAAVRAYDAALDHADHATLHALRIAFKRLRYAVSLFSGVLGKDVVAYIEELKTLQDQLGRLNDIDVACRSLRALMEDLEPDQNAVLRIYIDTLECEEPALIETFPASWKHFNSKTVQRKLANAVLAL